MQTLQVVFISNLLITHLRIVCPVMVIKYLKPFYSLMTKENLFYRVKSSSPLRWLKSPHTAGAEEPALSLYHPYLACLNLLGWLQS